MPQPSFNHIYSPVHQAHFKSIDSPVCALQHHGLGRYVRSHNRFIEIYHELDNGILLSCWGVLIKMFPLVSFLVDLGELRNNMAALIPKLYEQSYQPDMLFPHSFHITKVTPYSTHVHKVNSTASYHHHCTD